MIIEALTVCVGYADFLAQTLPRNLPLFDHCTVITSFDDAETIELCRELSVTCIPTDVMHRDGDAFNKGRAIDFGLGFLRRENWVFHWDADTYFPPMTRRMIEASHPDAECIYGMDRALCVGWDKWQTYICQDPRQTIQHRWNCLVEPPQNMPMGGRIVLRGQEGYAPIGFAQLWHGKHNRRYPVQQSTTAEHSDLLFSMLWPTPNRRLIEEVIAIHLESECAPLGANWKGRKTKRFGPYCPAQKPVCYGK